MPNLIEKSLRRYHILEQLGEGWASAAYKMFDTNLECNVALRIIRKDLIGLTALERNLFS